MDKARGPTERLACLAALGFLLLGSSCGIPEHMQVDKTLHPSNADKDVRFRTTYYFRTFDYCADRPGDLQPIKIDSVYRFRLTGKSSPLNQVHFESGTLSASQIAPFGATVAFDANTRQHYFKSQSEVKRDATRDQAYAEVRQALTLYKDIADQYGGVENLPSEVKPQLDSLIATRIAATSGTQPGPIASRNHGAATLSLDPAPTFDEILEAVKTGEPPPDFFAYANAETQKTALEQLKVAIERVKDEPAHVRAAVVQPYFDWFKGAAPPDLDARCRDLRRGFQILGPQGWETFDQDDRLVFAMTTSADPLLSNLQELSGRVLNAKAPGTAELILPLVEEEFRAKEAARLLGAAPEDRPEDSVAVLDAALGALKGGETPQ